MNFKKMAKRFFTLSQNHDGFTLVELIVVIAIMAILAGVAVPAYTGYINKANKASDLQLLGAINTAFAAAAMENNENIKALSDTPKPVWNGSKVVSTTMFGAEFEKYYGANADSEFKVIKGLYFSPADGVFVDNTENVNNAVNIFNQSNFAGKVETLAGSVDNLAGMLADRIEQDGVEQLYKPFMPGDEYNNFMEKYNLTDESSETEIANASVMYVADKLGGKTATDIATIMNGDPNNVIAEFGTIPTAAMMYGLMTGYANSEFNTDFELNSNPSGVTEVLNEFSSIYNTDGFQAYFNNTDTSKKGGMNDLDGFLAAMNVVNSYEGSFDLTDENLFVSDETNALLNSILGSK